MKKQIFFSILLMLALLMPVGTTKAQVVIGGGGGGLSRVSDGSLLATLFPNEDLRQPCRNGAKRMFIEYNRDREQDEYVWRVCQNGRYFQKAQIDYSKVGCREGAQSIIHDNDGEATVMRVYRCVKGKYVLAYPEGGN